MFAYIVCNFTMENSFNRVCRGGNTNRGCIAMKSENIKNGNWIASLECKGDQQESMINAMARRAMC